MPVRVQLGKRRNLIQEIDYTGEERAEKSDMELRAPRVRSHTHLEAEGAKGRGRTLNPETTVS